VDRACYHAWKRTGMHAAFQSKIRKEKEYKEDLDIDGRIILKCV
jgi:hypothetical protein